MELWHGFEKRSFLFEDREAVLVFPKAENKTNKWLFKTEYWDAFPHTEIEMLKHGWHVAYVKNKHRWGDEADIDLKARFCRYLADEFGLSERCVPVGMSCGGMFAVKFAAKYPQYVDALYLDAPVINFLSCPAGLGKAGNDMFDEFYNATGISLEELISYREHPLDKIPTLVKNKIPVVLVYGDCDNVVPYDENGKLLEKAYKEHNLDILTICKPGCGHHPHGLEDSTPIVEFILSHSN